MRPSQHRARELRTMVMEIRRLADQDQMDADIERGVLARQANGIVKRGAGSHQCGCGEDAIAVRFDNASIPHRG